MDNVDDEYERLVGHLHDCTWTAKSFKTTKRRLSPEAYTKEEQKCLLKLQRRDRAFTTPVGTSPIVKMTALRSPDGTTRAGDGKEDEKAIHNFHSDLFDSHNRAPPGPERIKLEHVKYLPPVFINTNEALHSLSVGMHATLENAMRGLEVDYVGMKVDDRHYHHLRFADDIILITARINQAKRMLAEFDETCKKIILQLNLDKIMFVVTGTLLRLLSFADVGRLRKNKPVTDSSNSRSVVPYLSSAEMEVKLNELYDAVSVGIHFVHDLQKTPRALDYARTLVHIEKLCENPGARRTNFDYSVDMSLAEALRKPHLCCARTPIGWNQDEFVETENLLDTLKQIYCRTVTLFADFASGCPELALLEEQDKLAICSKNYCGCVLFTLAYNAYLNDYYGILFPHGFKYSLSTKKDEHEFDEFLQTLFDYLHSNVVRVFRETGITTEEYTFVKTLILFSGGEFILIPLTDAGLSIVLRARRKYAALLSELITTTRPELSSVEAMNRLTRLFSLIPHMMHASEFDNLYCGKMPLRCTEAPREKLRTQLRKICDSTEEPLVSFSYSLDTSLADVLEKPHLCCHRTPIGWSQSGLAKGDNILEVLKESYCRSITHFADFAASCPELQMLEAKDRLAMCSANYCGVTLFLMVYNTYLKGCTGLLFPHGFTYKSSEKQHHEFDGFLQELVDYLHRNVVTVFREEKVTIEEYSLLKTLVLFAGTISLTDEGFDIVSGARRKYGALLAEYIVTSRTDLSPADQMERLLRLCSVVPHMMHASERDNSYCARMVLMNIGNLTGPLSYDLHIHLYFFDENQFKGMGDLKEPCSASLRSPCDNLDGEGPFRRFALLLSLPPRTKNQFMNAKVAESILSKIPDGLLEELLATDDEHLVSFQDLAVDVLETLLPYCHGSTLRNLSHLIPHLVHRLELTKDNMNALSSISKCIITLCFEIGSGNTEFVHDTADILTSFCVGNPKDFPFTPILERLVDCMLTLQHHSENYELVSKEHCWPKNVRTLVHAFLKTRTEMLSDAMRIAVFRLAKEVVETLGTNWFAEDVGLLLLLVHLVVVQTRMCLDEPTTINPESLAVCFHILESAIRCAEESSFVDDSSATQIAKSVREAALYSIQYWVEAKEQNECLPSEVELMIYRFTCCFLAIGGAQMLPESLLQKCSVHMLHVFEQSISSGDFTTACLLLPNLHDLPRLADNTITLITDLVLSQYPHLQWKQTVDEAVASLENLKSRVDFYSKKTVKEACLKLKAIPDCELGELLSNL
ncbi:hypothetical protein RB195_003207 [Necator americanus]|uniref:NR LBD domain-containing protein n=1 Tax=Necator americanus TaxID=51031 RepID=A0ABR1DQ98_NECAM